MTHAAQAVVLCFYLVVSIFAMGLGFTAGGFFGITGGILGIISIVLCGLGLLAAMLE